MTVKSANAYLLVLLAFGTAAGVWGQTNDDSALTRQRSAAIDRLRALAYTPPTYRTEALRLVIEEANRAAQELRLQEKLPIAESDLIAAYVAPPSIAGMMGIGNVTTTNYTYYVSVGSKFSFLERTGLNQEYQRLKEQFQWPMARMNTNSAYQLATQFLVNASMDMRSLNRDCDVHIGAFTPQGKTGSHFVPLYWVYWTLKGREGQGSVASVELLEPEKMLLQLRVEESKYILRKPLVITNLDYLLSQTNSPGRPNAPSKE